MTRTKISIDLLLNALLAVLFIVCFGIIDQRSMAQDTSDLKFAISFPDSVHSDPITGRAYVIVSKRDDPEPRFQTRRSRSSPFFGRDIEDLEPGEAALTDDKDLGFPLKSLAEIPSGKYYVQGFINIYTEFKRSDGHTIWLHDDEWEGQQWNRSPGNSDGILGPAHLFGCHCPFAQGLREEQEDDLSR